MHCHCSSLAIIPDIELDSSTFNQSSASDNDIAKSMFHVGETLVYSSTGRTSYVKVKEIFLNEDNQLTCKVVSASGDELTATQEQLRDPNLPDIAHIPSNIPDYKELATTISDDQLKAIANPVQLSPLQEEWLALHERLWHLPQSIMFRMVKAGFLNKKFLKLLNNRPPCVSCLFGQAHRKPWRYKSSTEGTASTLRGNKVSKPGQTVGADQLVSAQPGLVPQEKGALT